MKTDEPKRAVRLFLRRHLVARAAGLVVAQAAGGVVKEMPSPVVFIIDLLFALFLIRLWNSNPDDAAVLTASCGERTEL